MGKAKKTGRDILNMFPAFPSFVDEMERCGERDYSVLANIGRIKNNANHLLKQSELLKGKKAVLPPASRLVLEDCRAALRGIKTLEGFAEKVCTGVCDTADIAAVCEAAFHLGAIDQRMINRVVHDPDICRGQKQKLSLAKGPATKTKTAHQEYARINQAVADRIKKRGRRKQPSLTEIRRQVADQLGVKYSKVLDAQRGGRK